jgi:hypothetical protein
MMREVFEAWNDDERLTKCLLISDNRRRSLDSRLRDKFFSDNWRKAMGRIPASSFCMGRNERGWRANFDWFIRPDTVAKIMEGKYDDQKPAMKPTGGNL